MPVRQALLAPPPRVYVVVPQDSTASGAVAEGTFLVNDMPARILFDSGATHSFVDFAFVKELNLHADSLYPPLSV